MMRGLVLLVAAISASASNLGLLASDSASLSPTALAEAYAKEIPKVGSLMPKELLREHIRKDLMPRLMSNQDDRTAYELGLNIFEKLNTQPASLGELSGRMDQGKKLDKTSVLEIKQFNDDVTRDMELLQEKIRSGTSANEVSHSTLKLLANSAQGYSCAFKATEISILSKGMEQKNDCAMPFPGALIMLDQKIDVPEKVTFLLPSTEDVNYLRPQRWMSEHMRHTVWCKDSLSEDPICDAVSAALDMPRHDELRDERKSLMQLEVSQSEGKPAPAAMVELAPAVGTVLQQEEQTEDQFQRLSEEYARRSKEYEAKAAELKKKFSLLHQGRK